MGTSFMNWTIPVSGVSCLLFGTLSPLITPPLNGVRFAHEAAAIKAIQTIQTIEVQYNAQYGRLATSLTELGPPASGAAKRLLG
jgi:hypothetical protein